MSFLRHLSENRRNTVPKARYLGNSPCLMLLTSVTRVDHTAEKARRQVGEVGKEKRVSNVFGGQPGLVRIRRTGDNFRVNLRHQCTVVQNSYESSCKYWATRSSVRLFARTAHSFACSGLLTSLAPSTALTHSLACSLCSLPRSWESKFCLCFFPFWTIV